MCKRENFMLSKQGDIDFLREMKNRLEKAPTDKTQYEYLEKLIYDWIDELTEEINKSGFDYL